MERFEASSNPPAEERARTYGRAVRLDRAGRSGEARELAKRYLQSDPLDAVFIQLMAVIDLRGEKLQSVDRLTRRSALIDPTLPRTWFVRAMYLALVPDGAAAWRVLWRAYLIAGVDGNMFPSPPRRAVLPRRLLAGLGTSLLRKVWVRLHACWADDMARSRMVTGLWNQGDFDTAIEVARCFLVDDPADAEGWRRMSPVHLRAGDHGSAFEVQLRAGVLDDFSPPGSLAQLFYQRKRAAIDPKRVLPYIRERARRGGVETELLLALWRMLLAADPAPSGEALHRAASELASVAEARILAPVPFSEITRDPLVTFADASVGYDLIQTRLVVGSRMIVADGDQAVDAAARQYVRFKIEVPREIDRAFLLGLTRNHYDWLIEGSRALKVYVDAGLKLPLLMTGPQPTRAQSDLLAILGLEDRALPWITLPCRIRCRYLTATPYLFKADGMDAEHLRWLRQVVTDALSPNETRDKPRLVVLSRRDSKFRRVQNEDEIVAALEKRGFTSIATGGMGLREQAAHFAAADVVVAAKGAGLANIVFCRPGTRVVELSPTTDPFYDHFERISDFMGLSHRTVGGREPHGAEPWTNHKDLARWFDPHAAVMAAMEAVDAVSGPAGLTPAGPVA